MSRQIASISTEELAVALDLSIAFIRNLDGHILYWSSGSEKIYGWLQKEAVGRSSHELLSTRFSEPLDAINHTLLSCGSWSGNLLHKTRDNRTLNIFSHWVLRRGETVHETHVVEVNVIAAGQQPLLASLVDSTNDAVVGETLDGIVTSWNPAAARLFEYDAAEMIGSSVARLFPPLLADEETKLIARVVGGQSVSHYETTRVTKSGKPLTVSLTLSPIVNADGELVGISKIARDISERKRNEEALKRANESLEEFAYAAAHDLQEPLRNISLLLQHLALPESGLTDHDRSEMLKAAIRNSDRMQSLIRDLLAFSRAMDESANDAYCDANTVVGNAIENLASAIQDYAARIEVDSPLPSAVNMHEAHLLQLMQNLIGNSLKYRSEARSPVVQITARMEHGQVIFSVADNGLGIPAEYHERVFGVFKRIDNTKPGNGIGLAVCKRVVEHYGGTIWVDSHEGRGAKFSFSIPLHGK